MDLLFSLLKTIWKKCLIDLDLTPEVTGKVEKVHAGRLDTIFVDLNSKKSHPEVSAIMSGKSVVYGIMLKRWTTHKV